MYSLFFMAAILLVMPFRSLLHRKRIMSQCAVRLKRARTSFERRRPLHFESRIRVRCDGQGSFGSDLDPAVELPRQATLRSTVDEPGPGHA